MNMYMRNRRTSLSSLLIVYMLLITSVSVEAAVGSLKSDEQTLRQLDLGFMGDTMHSEVAGSDGDSLTGESMHFKASMLGETFSESSGEIILSVFSQTPTTRDAMVTVLLEDVSATLGVDYAFRDSAAASQRITIPAGNTPSIDVPIRIVNDMLREPDEQFRIRFTDPSGGFDLGPMSDLLITILDSSPPLMRGSVAFTQESYTVDEGERIELGVERSGGVDGEITVYYGSEPGESTDFAFSDSSDARSLTWSDQESGVKRIVVDTTMDQDIEGEEQFVVELFEDNFFVNKRYAEINEPGSVVGTPGSATVTINDDDLPTGQLIIIGETSFGQVRLGDAPIERLITLRNDRNQAVVGNPQLVSGDPEVAGVELTGGTCLALPNSVLQPNESCTGIFTLTPNTVGAFRLEASLLEFDPRFAPAPNLILTGEVLAPQRGQVRFMVSEQAIQEPENGQQEITLALERVGGADGRIMVEVVSADGTATASSADYEPVRQQLIWEDQETESKPITVLINSDERVEGVETLRVLLQEPIIEGDFRDESVLGEPRSVTLSIEDEDQPSGRMEISGDANFGSARLGDPVVTRTLTIRNGRNLPALFASGIQSGVVLGGVFRVRGGSCLSLSDNTLAPENSCLLTIEMLTGMAGDFSSDDLLAANDQSFPDPARLILTGQVTPFESGVVQFTQASLQVNEPTRGQVPVQVEVERVGGSDGIISLDVLIDMGTTSEQDFDRTSVPVQLTWLDGDTASQRFDVSINADSETEQSEIFRLQLVDPEVESLVNMSEAADIIGDPDTLEITINDVPPSGQIEITGDTDFGRIRLGDAPVERTITIRNGRNLPVVGNPLLLDGDLDAVSIDASGGTCLGLPASTLPPGASCTVTFVLIPDRIGSFRLEALLTDADPRFPAAPTLVLSGEVLAPTRGQVRFTTAAATVIEPRNGQEMLTVTIERVDGVDGAIELDVITEDDTAIAEDGDYDTVRQQLVWLDQEGGAKTVMIPVNADSLSESTETFNVVLNERSLPDEFDDCCTEEPVVGEPSRVRVTIEDGARLGRVRFAIAELSVSEADGAVNVNVIREDGADGPLSVGYTFEPGTASLGTDVAVASGRLSWTAGDSEPRRITFTPQRDDIREPDETFSIVLAEADPVGAIGSPSTLQVTLTDRTMRGRPEFVQDTFVFDESAGNVSLGVSRVDGQDGELVVRYTTIDNSAINGEDYMLAAGELIWAGGEQGEQAIDLQMLTDSLPEDTEDFQVVLAVQGEELETDVGPRTDRAVVSIEDTTEPGTIRWTSDRFTVQEDAGEVVVTAERVNGDAGRVSVSVMLESDTAIAGEDFTDLDNATLTWNDGESGSRSINIELVNDTLIEGSETFRIQLVDPQPSSDDLISQSGSEVVLLDSSIAAPVVLSVLNEADLVVAEADGALARITLQRSGDSQSRVVMPYTIGSDDDSAENTDYSGADGSLVWAAGDSSDKVILIPIVNDELLENNESFTVRFGTAQTSWPDGLVNPPTVPDVQSPVNDVLVLITDDDNIPSDDPQTAPVYVLEVIDGDEQRASPGQRLPGPLQVRVRLPDTAAAVPQVEVTWTVLADPTALNPEVATFVSATGEVLGSVTETVADENGLAQVFVNVLRSGFIGIRATPTINSVNSNLGAQQRSFNSRMRADQPVFARQAGDAVFTIRAGIAPTPELTLSEASAARSIDDACDAIASGEVETPTPGSAAADFARLCDLNLEGNSEVSDAMRRLLPEEVFTMGSSIIDTTDIQVSNVYSRINAVRAGRTRAFDLSGANLQLFGQSIPGSVLGVATDALGISGAGASSDNSPTIAASPLSFFLNGSVLFGKADETANETGQEFSTRGLTFGADYRIDAKRVVGVSLGLAQSDSNFASDGGGLDLDGKFLSLFATWYEPARGYIDAVLEYGRHDYALSRRINLDINPVTGSILPTTVDDQFALGDTNANSFALTLGAGYDFSNGDMEFGPYGRFSVITADVNEFDERASNPDAPGTGYVLSIAKHSVRSATLSLGGQLSRSYSTSRGVFVPQLRLEAQWEAEDRNDGINASFQEAPLQIPFSVESDSTDTFLVNYGVGASAVFRNGRSGFLFYEGQEGNRGISQGAVKGWGEVGVLIGKQGLSSRLKSGNIEPQLISVPILTDDSFNEAVESFTITLLNATPAQSAVLGTATVSIVDSTNPGTLEFDVD